MFADHVSVSLTNMSPLPDVVAYRLVDELDPVSVSIWTLFRPNSVERADPVMSPPLAAMVKSYGSSSHFPFNPAGAAVLIIAPSPICR